MSSLSEISNEPSKKSLNMHENKDQLRIISTQHSSNINDEIESSSYEDVE